MPKGMVGSFKNLCETHIIDAACSESFLPLHHEGCAALVAASVSLAGVSQLRRHYEIGRPSAPYHVLLMTLGGRGKLRTSRSEHQLMPGNFCLLPAGLSYSYALAGREWRMAWFHFLNRKRWQKLRCQEPLMGVTANEAEIVGAMNLLSIEGNSPSLYSTRLIQLQSELLLLLIDRLFGTTEGVVPSPYEESLKALWHEVEGDLARSWTVTMLARRLHVTPGHLYRVVRGLHGITPMQMVTKLRMQRAEYLLQHTPSPISRIAEAVGYSDSFAFSTAFKRMAGFAPSVLRRAPDSSDRRA